MQTKTRYGFFIPYNSDDYYHTIWINDYVNKAWYKRVVPQDVTAACLFEDYVVTGDASGNIYREDYGNSLPVNR